MARFFEFRIICALALTLLVSQTIAQITFTGNAETDFNIPLNDPRRVTLKYTPNYNNVTVTDWMRIHNQTSGFDLKALIVQYDYRTDTLFVGIDCWVICGDSDGDGNPSVSTDRGNTWFQNATYVQGPDTSKFDTHLQISVESIALTMWTNPPPTFTNQPHFIGYEPDIVIGEDYQKNLDQFGVYTFDVAGKCEVAGLVGPECQLEKNSMNSSPGFNFGTNFYYQADAREDGRKIQFPQIYAYPNTTTPDLEYRLLNFSNYGNFNFTPGLSKIKYAFAIVMSNIRDGCGEEVQYPQIQEIECQLIDACGLCGGDNTTCWGCDRVPNSNKTYDSCGVCGGTNSTCLDCRHVPNGPARYDACGVCAGDNHTCFDCAHIPNGPNRYDACGVCNGDNHTCWDCRHIPNGPARYDACGVCNGDNHTCFDCAHIPNGPARYDACGVCAGDNHTCFDCAHIPNGPNQYDACGVCNGDNHTCFDCAHIPNGPARYDACGVCDGDNSTCFDCAYIPNGPNRYDACGVCNGDNSTCFDCKYIPNGPNRYDVCGICAGKGDTCLDCNYDPFGGKKYDRCGICGGDNSGCECFFEDDIIFYPEDTWIELAHREKNHWESEHLEVKYNRSRSLVQFRDVCHTILQKHKHLSPEYTNILSAHLEFTIAKVGEGWEDKDLAIHRICEYEEKEANWDCSGYDIDNCCKQWRMIGLPPQVVPSYDAEPSGVQQLTPGQTGRVIYELTEEITKLVYNDGPCNTLSYLLKKVCEHGTGAAWFRSSKTGHVLSPKLVVRVKTFCPSTPLPPTPEPPCPDDEMEWNWDADNKNKEKDHKGHGHKKH